MSNENNNQLDDLPLEDYEVFVPEKKGVFSSAIENIKNLFTKKDKQKYFPLENSKAKTTGRSISSLWDSGSIRTKLIKALEDTRKRIFKPKEPKVKNGFNTEIIGGKTQDSPEDEKKQEQAAIQDKKIIFHETEKFKAKNIINNSKTAEDVALENNESIPEQDVDSEGNSLDTSEKSDLKVATIDDSAVRQTVPENIVGTIHIQKQPELIQDSTEPKSHDDR